MATATQTVEPYKEQEPFLWDSHRYYGFISGVGAGKTAVGVIRTALNAEMWNRGSMGAIVAPSTRMIKNAIFPVMKQFGIRDRWDFTGFQAEEPGFHTPGEGRIVILSADNERTVERLANLNLSFWWLDEAKETPERAREILRERLRVGNYRNGYITTTPNGYDHNYDFFVGDPEDADELEKWDHGEGRIYEGFGDRLCVAGVPSWANPHTPEDYHEEMRNLPDEIRLQQAEGQFVEIGSGLFTRDMLEFISLEEVQEIGTERNFKYITAVDVGVEADATKARDNDTDYWAAALLMLNQYDGEAYLIDVKRKRGMSLKQGVEWLRGVVQEVPRGSPIYVESNQSQRWFKQQLKDSGLNAIAEVNTTGKEERIVQMSIPLENGTVKLLNRNPDTQLGYDEKWRPWIQELLSFPDGGHDDMIDATELAIRKANIGSSTNTILGADPYGDNGDT